MLGITRRISKYNFSSRKGNSIKYIVLHYTGNKQDSAEGNANYFNGGDRNASAHYFVDNNSIYQVVEESNAAWSVGDGYGRYGITNYNSINIEMCTSGNYNVSEETENNAIDLVKTLMAKYGVSIDRVVRHYDASRKVCPNWSDNNWSRWSNFKNKLTNNATNNTVNTVSGEIYRVRKSWNDARSQIGAYRNLESAKKLATGDYKVFDSKGNIVYQVSNQTTVQAPIIQFNAHLRDLQSAYNHDYGQNIYVDGIRGQQVENMLNRLCLRHGSKGQCVGWLQCRVGAKIDDIFGNETKNKVMEFQRNNGLVVDGIAGRNTFNKLLEIYR